jgi:5-methylthioadenosine/S-adenosylhomocysteine deaminase
MSARRKVPAPGAHRDLFTSAYLAANTGVVTRPNGAVRHAAAMRATRALPADSVALGGTILGPAGAKRGWLTIEGGVVSAISSRKPDAAQTLTTDGVVMPGLIDLHGHPEFNVFAPWEPSKDYINRYAWRDSPEYHKLIRDPQNSLLAALPAGTELRYAEIRALVGGATAIQGGSTRNVDESESLVRNVDGLIFGQRQARALIDLPASLTGFGGSELANILTAIGSGDVVAFYVHLAEGQRDNQRSIDEFDHLVGLGALTPATVIIHGTAMTRDHFAAAAEKGAKLVWSPQSNLRLYGQTTQVADALDAGLQVGLGADWLPSGSTSLLAEMKVARQQLIEQGAPLPADVLVAMVTSTAADIAGLGDRLGTLDVGRPADVVVLARRATDPYESVCAAHPNDVELVLIGGKLAYGRTDWITMLAADAANLRLEPVIAWGRSMLLDTGVQGTPNGAASPSLGDLRRTLTSIYPQVGPIWA